MTNTTKIGQKTKEVSTIRQNAIALLVQIKSDDGQIKHLYTNYKNLRYLVEFASQAGAGLHKVKVTKANILTLKDLADHIQREHHEHSDYKVVKVVVPMRETSRPEVQKKKNYTQRLPTGAVEIVQNILLNGETVRTREICSHLAGLGCSKDSAKYILKKTIKQLNDGNEFIVLKPKRGTYKCIKAINYSPKRKRNKNDLIAAKSYTFE